MFLPTGYLDSISIFCFLWLLTVFIISLFKLKSEFHLGGILCGFAFLLFLSWISNSAQETGYSSGAEMLLFTCAVIYLEIGVFFHWFSRMEHRISYDPLLQIYNRNYCSKIIEEQSHIQTKPPFGVAMIDIDHFKSVNDKYGHQAGDNVLFQVAQIILRETVPDGIACRYGGEEIIVFFPKKVTKEIVKIMEKVRKTIENTKIPIKRKKLTVTASFGISHRASYSQKIMDIIHAADKALYRAKKYGRNQVKTGKAITPYEKKK
jgi:diguanylate cyclase (GGDEF)-like protein